MARWPLLVLVFATASICSADEAKQMKLTIYDDGLSCPGSCDAHVVMNPVDNGTENAFLPGSKRSDPKECVEGASCTICFNEADESCMSVLYRGGGPPAGTFDFTPAFYDEYCQMNAIPSALAAQCASLTALIKKKGYDKRLNCFEYPKDPKCVAVLTEAKAAQDGDIPIRNECLQMGEKAFNKAQPTDATRRRYACNYTQELSGGTPAKRWHKLLPAACRPGTYVDPQGLDCCSGRVNFAAYDHPECVSFFPN